MMALPDRGSAIYIVTDKGQTSYLIRFDWFSLILQQS